MNIYLIDFQTGHKVNRNKHRSNHVTNHPSYGGWGLSHDKLFFLASLIDHEETEIYNWKWMVLGVLGCMNNADFEGEKNDIIVLDVFIICQKLGHLQVI